MSTGKLRRTGFSYHSLSPQHCPFSRHNVERKQFASKSTKWHTCVITSPNERMGFFFKAEKRMCFTSQIFMNYLKCLSFSKNQQEIMWFILDKVLRLFKSSHILKIAPASQIVYYSSVSLEFSRRKSSLYLPASRVSASRIYSARVTINSYFFKAHFS